MGKLAIAFLLGAAAGAAAMLFRHGPQDVVDEEEPVCANPPADVPEAEKAALNDADEAPEGAGGPEENQTCRAEILEACRDMDPVTLQGWSRVSFLCEDGETRKFTFAGANGLYLVSGEKGLLEYRGKGFVGFEKDSGEYVSPLFHVPPETEE